MSQFLYQIERELRGTLNELEYLRERVAELEHYKKEYHDLLDQSVQHGQQMMGGFMRLFMDKSFTDAMSKREQTNDATTSNNSGS